MFMYEAISDLIIYFSIESFELTPTPSMVASGRLQHSVLIRIKTCLT